MLFSVYYQCLMTTIFSSYAINNAWSQYIFLNIFWISLTHTFSGRLISPSYFLSQLHEMRINSCGSYFLPRETWIQERDLEMVELLLNTIQTLYWLKFESLFEKTYVSLAVMSSIPGSVSAENSHTLLQKKKNRVTQRQKM